MKTYRLRVKVGEGLFAGERSVSFTVGDRNYSLLVVPDQIKDDTLSVFVVDESEDEALVDLPGEALTSGNRIRMPKSALLPAA